MFQSIQHRRRREVPMAIDIAPMIDVVFILLIFFLVAATFVQETGVEVQRPAAAAVQQVPPESLRVSIAPGGGVFVAGRAIDLHTLGRQVHEFVSRHPQGAVLVIPDVRLPTGRLIEVMDTARQAGARNLSVAADARETR